MFSLFYLFSLVQLCSVIKWEGTIFFVLSCFTFYLKCSGSAWKANAVSDFQSLTHNYAKNRVVVNGGNKWWLAIKEKMKPFRTHLSVTTKVCDSIHPCGKYFTQEFLLYRVCLNNLWTSSDADFNLSQLDWVHEIISCLIWGHKCMF